MPTMGWSGNLQGGGRGVPGAAGGDAELGGGKLSLALLEETKLWTAILLRLSRKLPIWKAQAPMLAQVAVRFLYGKRVD